MAMMTGLILAGGPNTRMDGESKAFFTFEGEPLIKRQIKEMKKCCDEVIIVTQEPKPFLRTVDIDVRIITDYYAGKGPLGGMHSGFSLSKYPEIWVVGSDMPFLSSKAAELLLNRKRDGFDAAVPLINGGIYSFHRVYDKRCSEQVTALLQTGEKQITALLKEIFWFEILDKIFIENGIDPCFVTNLNTWDDYKKVLKTMKHL
jgi:molybdopterin-guanine dinucleotide biosynthesis protein A